MSEERNNYLTPIGIVVMFSFASIIFIFMAILLLGSLNNYALNDLLSILSKFIANGLVPSEFYAIAEASAETYLTLIPYLDIIWFGSFISMIGSSLLFSYIRKRENYFNLFINSILGLIIFTYIGSIFIQFTTWFRDELLFKVFPTISTNMPLFTWYLDYMAIINLILFCLIIIVNFVDLDFSRFNRKKEEGVIDEI